MQRLKTFSIVGIALVNPFDEGPHANTKMASNKNPPRGGHAFKRFTYVPWGLSFVVQLNS